MSANGVRTTGPSEGSCLSGPGLWVALFLSKHCAVHTSSKFSWPWAAALSSLWDDYSSSTCAPVVVMVFKNSLIIALNEVSCVSSLHDCAKLWLKKNIALTVPRHTSKCCQKLDVLITKTCLNFHSLIFSYTQTID